MTTQPKIIAISVFATFFIFLISILDLEASEKSKEDFRKKISVEDFGPPAGWAKSYNPGTLIADSLRKGLKDKGYTVISSFGSEGQDSQSMGTWEEMVNALGIGDTATVPTKKMAMNGDMSANSTAVPSGMKSGEMGAMPMKNANGKMDPMGMNSKKKGAVEVRKRLKKRILNPAQLLIRGSVWTFDPSTKSMFVNKNRKRPGFASLETARIKFDVELVDTMSGKVLWKDNVLSEIGGGEKLFSSNMLKGWPHDIDDFYLTSLGFSLNTAVASALGEIEKRLKNIPLEGQVIAADESKKMVWINLGKDVDVSVREVFNVYDIKFDWKDPDTNVSLGDEYILQGAVKILETQDGISRAKILAGDTIRPGHIARLRNIERLNDGR